MPQTISYGFTFTVVGGEPFGGVLFDAPDGRAYAVVVGNDPGSHGLHFDHPHPPRNFPPTTKTMARPGRWTDPLTWSGGAVPTDDDVVVIPAFRDDETISTRLTARLFVTNTGGACTIRKPDPARTFTHVIPDVPLDPALDPEQWGNVFGAVGGILVVEGAEKLAWCELAVEPRAGHTSLSLTQPAVGWRPGDVLVMEDTRELKWEPNAAPTSIYHITKAQFERPLVASVSADGMTVHLAAPLLFDHLGARGDDGLVGIPPAVGNLTRNVVVESANASDPGRRGHCLFHGRADVTRRYVEFRNTGRSLNSPWGPANFKGRYGGHDHHLLGPQRSPEERADPAVIQGLLEGCSAWNTNVEHDFRWGWSSHGTGWCVYKNNVFYNWRGWGIGTEDGTERLNTFKDNFIVCVPGLNGSSEAARGAADIGHTNVGLWFASGEHHIVGNRANGCQKGMTIIPYLNPAPHAVKVAAYKGADPRSGDPSQYEVVEITARPLVEVRDNTLLGRTDVGLDMWRINSKSNAFLPGAARSYVYGTRVGNLTGHGYYNYMTTNVSMVGVVGRGGNVAFFSSDYIQNGLELVGCDIQRFKTGLLMNLGSVTVRGGLFRCWRGVEVRPQWIASMAPDLVASRVPVPRALVLEGVRFGPSTLPGNSSWGLRGDIVMAGLQANGSIYNGTVDLTLLDQTFVKDHQGVAGDDFRLYYPQQSASAVLPASAGNIKGCPVAGLTNAQALAQYGVCFAGELAPPDCTARAGIVGLVKGA